jgi:uncharacterized protein YbaA (DUF1428 family)
MDYVDGFVAAVPTANRERYVKHSKAAAAVFKDHGALRVVECWGNDVPRGGGDVVPAGRPMQGRRDRDLFVDHVAVA